MERRLVGRPIIEKEGFAIMEAVTRLDYLLMRPGGFTIFTDHRNLEFLFNPEGTSPGLQRHAVAQVSRPSSLCSSSIK